MKQLRNFKGEMNFTKKNIRALRDDNLPEFNPGAFLNVSDVDTDTLKKYGEEIFPDHFRKKKEKSIMATRRESHSIASPKSGKSPNNGDTTRFNSRKVSGGFSSLMIPEQVDSPKLKNRKSVNIST